MSDTNSSLSRPDGECAAHTSGLSQAVGAGLLFQELQVYLATVITADPEWRQMLLEQPTEYHHNICRNAILRMAQRLEDDAMKMVLYTTLGKLDWYAVAAEARRHLV